ncbi:hypothetical protein WJX81_002415 [Elliptochloris bilobata]|uniref:peptidylprolyl isomerase n=1 Tax=Elliptochloris bilobata TaxID=381761 RepID=A0AAW1RKK4_9CHLO
MGLLPKAELCGSAACARRLCPFCQLPERPNKWRASRTTNDWKRKGVRAASGAAGSASETSGVADTSRRQALAAVFLSSTALARRAQAQTKGVVDGGATELLPTAVAKSLSLSGKQVLETNRRVQAQNNSPADFPGFVRQGYDIKVLADGYQVDNKGLIFKDVAEGSGERPADGQEVVFDYIAYNESGVKIDSSYNKGRPASIRLGINGLIPGFELGIKGMRPGGKRRMVVPPELGPPVGPSTFFSAKQCEVFDVELHAVHSCQRRQFAMFSDVVCDV